MEKIEMDVWRSGTGKVIAIGDVVYTDPTVRGSKGSYRYRVQAIRTFEVDGRPVVEVDVWGGEEGKYRLRTFRPEVLHRTTKVDALR